ncbi:hypothetical protein [Tolypothrix sp. VBCCA 56010]|uniref:hypothetical protein n=1 Tax=Tolypothrix sp. VBCCA 56010 TaxID=3137731 RepID=UPI003D7D89E6
MTDLDLVGQVKYCWQRWREGKVLLVLDDVTIYKEIVPYLPPSSSRFKVLMTTRKHFGQISKLPLDVLQPQAALELLRKLIGDERIDLTPQPLSRKTGFFNSSPKNHISPPEGYWFVAGAIGKHPN